MVANGLTPAPADTPMPNVPLILMFGHIADGEAAPDQRDSASGWADQRLRMKLIRLLKRLRFA
jgi:hypothetical protein